MGDEYEPSSRLIGPFHNGTSNRAIGSAPTPTRTPNVDKSGGSTVPATAPVQRGTRPSARTRDKNGDWRAGTVGETGQGVEHRLARDAAESVRSDQKRADDLEPQIRRHFLEVCPADVRKLNPQIGARIEMKVLAGSDFSAAQADKDDAVWRDSYNLMFKYDYDHFLRLFMPVWKPKVSPGASPEFTTTLAPRLTGTYMTPPHSLAELTDSDANLLVPKMSTSGRAAGFWFEKRATIYIRLGDVNGGTIAHELCHAYTSKRWRDLVYRLFAYSQIVTPIGYLYEGTTAGLADVVIASWLPPSSRMDSSTRRKDAPSGFGGYDYHFKAMAEALFEYAGQDAVVAAYFAGKGLKLSIDKKMPVRSTITIDKKSLLLEELFARAGALEYAFKAEYQ